MLMVPPLLEVLPLRGLVPLGDSGGYHFLSEACHHPSHSHRFPLQLNFGPQSNSEPSTCEEFRHTN